MAYGMSALKICTFFRWGKTKTATLADFIPETTEEMENHFAGNNYMKDAGRYLFSVDFMEGQIRNQNLARPMDFGENATRKGRRIWVFYYFVTRNP